MSKTTLQAYGAQLKKLLDQQAVDEAIMWAQHLLRTYPKYIQGYQFLAEAALERGDLREAADLFRRVLSADPENFMAHAGLSYIYSEEGVLDEALWQMMRAFELAPANGEIRQQLRSLYEKKEGRAPGRLKFNRAALARGYLNQGWYERAADELRAQIAEEPDRVDLQVALAEALWRSGMRQDAVRAAQAVLQELPFCLKANLILGQFQSEEGNTDLAWQHLQLAQALDPANEVARALFGEDSFLPPQEATVVEPLATARSGLPAFDSTDVPDWLSAIGMEDESEPIDWNAIEPEGFGESLSIDWRAFLRDATADAIKAWRPDWRIELRGATRRALAIGGANWRHHLRRATWSALEGLGLVPVAPAAQRSARPAGWVGDLHQATHNALSAYTSPTPVRVFDGALAAPEAASAGTPADTPPSPDARLVTEVPRQAPQTPWIADLWQQTHTSLDQAIAAFEARGVWPLPDRSDLLSESETPEGVEFDTSPLEASLRALEPPAEERVTFTLDKEPAAPVEPLFDAEMIEDQPAAEESLAHATVAPQDEDALAFAAAEVVALDEVQAFEPEGSDIPLWVQALFEATEAQLPILAAEPPSLLEQTQEFVVGALDSAKESVSHLVEQARDTISNILSPTPEEAEPAAQAQEAQGAAQAEMSDAEAMGARDIETVGARESEAATVAASTTPDMMPTEAQPATTGVMFTEPQDQEQPEVAAPAMSALELSEDADTSASEDALAAMALAPALDDDSYWEDLSLEEGEPDIQLDQPPLTAIEEPFAPEVAEAEDAFWDDLALTEDESPSSALTPEVPELAEAQALWDEAILAEESTEDEAPELAEAQALWGEAAQVEELAQVEDEAPELAEAEALWGEAALAEELTQVEDEAPELAEAEALWGEAALVEDEAPELAEAEALWGEAALVEDEAPELAEAEALWAEAALAEGEAPELAEAEALWGEAALAEELAQVVDEAPELAEAEALWAEAALVEDEAPELAEAEALWAEAALAVDEAPELAEAEALWGEAALAEDEAPELAEAEALWGEQTIIETQPIAAEPIQVGTVDMEAAFSSDAESFWDDVEAEQFPLDEVSVESEPAGVATPEGDVVGAVAIDVDAFWEDVGVGAEMVSDAETSEPAPRVPEGIPTQLATMAAPPLDADAF